MESQEIGNTRKRRGPKPTTGRGLMVGIRMHGDVLDPLDAWIAIQPDPTITRQQAILQTLRKHLGVKVEKTGT